MENTSQEETEQRAEAIQARQPSGSKSLLPPQLPALKGNRLQRGYTTYNQKGRLAYRVQVTARVLLPSPLRCQL